MSLFLIASCDLGLNLQMTLICCVFLFIEFCLLVPFNQFFPVCLLIKFFGFYCKILVLLLWVLLWVFSDGGFLAGWLWVPLWWLVCCNIFWGFFFENKNPVTSKQGKTRPISQKNITAKKQTLQKTSLRRKTPLCRKTNNAEKNNTVGFFQFGFCWRILVSLL